MSCENNVVAESKDVAVIAHGVSVAAVEPDPRVVAVESPSSMVVVEREAIRVVSVGQQGPPGIPGHDGEPGPQGEQGEPGTPGVGVPTGGTEGQLLAKATSTDYDTEWTYSIHTPDAPDNPDGNAESAENITLTSGNGGNATGEGGEGGRGGSIILTVGANGTGPDGSGQPGVFQVWVLGSPDDPPTLPTLEIAPGQVTVFAQFTTETLQVEGSFSSTNDFNQRTVIRTNSSWLPTLFVDGPINATNGSHLQVSSNVAIVTTVGQNPFNTGQQVQISGYTGGFAFANGTWTVTGFTETTFSFAVVHADIAKTFTNPAPTCRAITGVSDIQQWSSRSSTGVNPRISNEGDFFGGAIVVMRTSAPADSDLATSQLALWFDSTNGASKLKVKGKSANGTVVTGEVALA